MVFFGGENFGRYLGLDVVMRVGLHDELRALRRRARDQRPLPPHHVKIQGEGNLCKPGRGLLYLPAPWSETSQTQTNYCGISHPICDVRLWQPKLLRQWNWSVLSRKVTSPDWVVIALFLLFVENRPEMPSAGRPCGRLWWFGAVWQEWRWWTVSGCILNVTLGCCWQDLLEMCCRM